MRSQTERGLILALLAAGLLCASCGSAKESVGVDEPAPPVEEEGEEGEATPMDQYNFYMGQAGMAVSEGDKEGALDYYLDRPLQIVLVAGSRDETAAMLAPVRATFLPNRALSAGSEEELAALAELVPLVAGKTRQQGRATAYVCRGQVCDLPTTDPAALAAELARVGPLEPLERAR